MLSNTFAPASARRRGIVLILVLATLALMAVIGVTFATFTGQGKIGARSFAQSVLAPRPDDLMDFALQQLIADTGDVRSAIRGHSLARDMYGNDAANNGYLTSRPDGAPKPPGTDPFFYVTGVGQVGTSTQYNLTTNIPVGDPAFYGYNFTRWTMRLTFIGAPTAPGTGVVDQTLEILADTSPGAYRVFTVDMAPTDKATILSTSTPDPWPNLPLFPNGYPNGHYTQLPGSYLANGTGTFRFILDGRRLRAFNGPGMGAGAVYGNFRYNGGLLSENATFTQPGDPNAVGMDEDYDACDLENWFLAIQSADGQVIIPSFHRPGIIRYDPMNGVNDWARTNPAGWADSAARILRPVAADGHDPATFPDLVPDQATGKITFDVDNDADGVTDSVWLDLGYPAHLDSSGRLSKPLFAFLVIGLNGRIPLNTAGNLAGTGSTHATHLGNSVSEIDPTYGLQNAFDITMSDPTYAFTPPVLPAAIAQANTQYDSGGTDVRLTQLRNLLAGTRPQQNPMPSSAAQYPWISDPTGSSNGDDNFVLGAWPNKGGGQPYFLPNGIADFSDVPISTNPPQVQRTTPAVPGRWGEAPWIPGQPVSAAGGQVLNLVANPYNNPVRAGYSFGIADLLNDAPCAAADDNYNQFDPFPIGHTGEVNDRDFFDSAGGLMLPVDRMRRFVTPVDIDGTGRIVQYDPSVFTGTLTIGSPSVTGISNMTGLVAGETIVGTGIPVGTTIMTVLANTITLSANATVNGSQTLTTTLTLGPNLGGDQWGRVEFAGYFRPPGAPGFISLDSGGGATPGTVVYPSANLTFPSYLPDVTNNPLHGFEAQRFPNLNYPAPSVPPGFNPQWVGGVPIDLPVGTPPPPATPYPILPTTLPTYDLGIRTNGLNEADEMNLYVPNAHLDAPFGYGDLEWLYRQQDVDGGSLVSRLAQLAPVSFTNTIDGQRRRRLFSLDSWELNNFVWTNDNPGNVFPNNSNFPMVNPSPPLIDPSTGAPINVTNASFASLSAITTNNTGTSTIFPTPSLAHRDKKINLNYPLPVSNDPDELIRRKWISDTYQLLKWVLPPRAVDTPEELAQLSQFVINIIDFRDPDCTMTHWINPDVSLAVWDGTGTVPVAPVLIAKGAALPTSTVLSNTTGQFDQYGMEYNPVALNEVLAFSYAYQGVGSQANRFFVELVNTLTQSAFAAPPPAGGGTNPPDPSILTDPSILNLGGFQYAPGDPYSGGCWDLVFTDDTPNSRPDPYRGELVQGGQFYALIPLNKDSFTASPAGATAGTSSNPGSDVTLVPLGPAGVPLPAASPPTPPTNFFYAFGNSPANPALETWTPSLVQYLSPAADPFNGPARKIPWYPGVLPGVVADPGTSTWSAPPNYQSKLPTLPTLIAGSQQTTKYYWVCLRRPANPFAPVSAANPMLVVDAMRFPYIYGTVTGSTGNTVYSAQRFQPYRGGHAVPVPVAAGTPAGVAAPQPPLDTRYGYTEQIVGAHGLTYPPGTQGVYPTIYHTLGIDNDQHEPWDYFPFHDRDFTGVAELMLVPGCPPGLFTKQFAEFAPSTSNSGLIFALVQPQSAPPGTAPQSFATAATAFVTGETPNPVTPHTFPYLVDKFFYSGYGGPVAPATAPPADPGGVVGGYGADGWFKMFEFFEVPSQMMGATGPVAQGTNFDWDQQDTKPGLINLNLIIDEEVFFSVFGQQDQNFNQQLLNFYQLPPLSTPGWTGGPWPGPLPVLTSPVPIVVTATNLAGAPTYAYPMNSVGVVAADPSLTVTPPAPAPPVYTYGNRMKTSFAQFLSLRHGGSGYVFGYGSGYTGQNLSVSLPTPNPNNLAPFKIPTDRPFHSLSYPDINYTVMRPAALPPSAFTDPVLQTAAAKNYTGDPGLKNPFLYVGYQTGQPPVSTATSLVLPPAIPTRRLFQVPDDAAAATASAPSNASEQGDPSINNQAPLLVKTNPTTGALPPFLIPPFLNESGVTVTPNSGVVNLFWPGTNTPTGNPNVTNPYLGTGGSGGGSVNAPIDNRQHPYWRSELMQKAMNLTTVRTHQYAVWITVGFFEVKRRGNVGMIASADPRLAFDILGPEIGLNGNKLLRYRGFFLVDRLKLNGFDPTTTGPWHSAVVYRQNLQ